MSHDSCAAVVVSRHPADKGDSAIRGCRIWTPPRGEKIDLTETMEKWIMEESTNWNVVEYAYDEYQLHELCADLRKRLGRRFRPFSQAQERAVSDKQLYEMILQKQLAHTGHAGLRSHVDNAAIKKDGKSLRFIKQDQSKVSGISAKPIDALVAASMSNAECQRLNLG